MKRSVHILGAVAVLAAALIFANPTLEAGRTSGPVITTGTVPAGMSVFYDFAFDAGTPAIVTVANNRAALVNVMIYDSDGHVAMGGGNLYRQTARMDVYRAGVLRIEVHNFGIFDNTFTLTTN